MRTTGLSKPIRAKEGLGDISVAPRRFNKHYGGPDRLYEIHVDSGQVSTAIREYPDKLKTHEVPWIFWVDSTGILWGQLWSDISTRIELATGVDGSKGVKALRGWKTLEAENRDQGIIVAYIKNDGKVYYRQLIQLLDLTYIWDNQYTLSDFTGVAINLNLFITNDFRIGFVVADNIGQIHWFVTPRNYSAMTIGRDVISLRVGSDAQLTIGEIETLMYQAPADTVSVNASSTAVMGLYEDGETTHELSITGEY